MSFEKGTIGITIFRLAEKLPDNALELFAAKAAGKLEDVTDSISVGWTGGRDLLQCNINKQTAIYGGHIFLQLRIAQRKVPPSILNAHCRQAELEYMTMNKLSFIPGKVRRQIKKEISERFLPAADVQLAGIPFVIGPCNTLYLGTTSPKNIATFLGEFYDIFKREPVLLGINEMLPEHLRKSEKLPFIPVKFSRNAKEYSNPGRDFLTWLWFYSEEKGGKVAINDSSFEIMLEGPLVFAMTDEAEGSRETVVRKDNPMRSAEAKAALDVGKKLRKAKLTLARGEEVWKCVFDADQFTFSGLSLPEMELLDDASMFAERVNSIYIFQNAIQEYFNTFVNVHFTVDWLEEQDKILQWSEARSGY